MASSLSVRCMRSCRPFCWGLPGSMSSGVMPREIHQSCNSQPRVVMLRAQPGSKDVRSYVKT